MMATISTYLIAALFIAAGIGHFVRPGMFVRIVPPYLPSPLALVYVSGVFEVLGGLGVLFPQTRVWAGWGLILLLLAVFPVHVYMLRAADTTFASIPTWILYLRLPLQFVLIAWIYWALRLGG